MILVDHHRYTTVDISHKTYVHDCTADQLCFLFIMRQNGASINQAEAIKLSKFCNMSSVIVRKDLSLVKTIKAIFTCSGVFEFEYDVRIVDARIKDIVYNRLSSEYLRRRMPAIYVLYIWFAKLCLKNDQLLPLLKRLNIDVCCEKNLGNSHVDILVLFSSESDEI